ncbi:DMT family transporter [Erythrobacter mangrovi]|uniref:DMT family transporter n=1 Tax=Erythrobacter mangrovi TaxID=2739433 RepID=A0A7D3XTS1_9SPHN|nr:DMT family transporter [Erythrobacter mangrovi]
MLAFAGNSLLARAALADAANSPGAFAAVRLGAGAVLLVGFAIAGRFSIMPQRRDMSTVAALFVYALGFALAYVSMGAASGALILFAAVQATIIGVGLLRGDRIGSLQAVGLVIALAGVGWLLFPGLTAPRPVPALLMAAAGVAWGIYSTVNSGDDSPTARTARNFCGAAVLGLVALLVLPFELTPTGWMLATVSGAVTSALGYVLWYAFLPHVQRLVAASLQLSVPAITAVGAALLLGEAIGLRLIVASTLIIAGIALTLRR